MKKILILSLAIVLATFGANAQFRDITCDNGSIFELVQIDTSAFATTFYFTATAQYEDGAYFRVNSSTYVTAEGVMKRYKLLGTGNIPMSNENAAAYIEKKGGKLNFVLIFEPMPLDKALTIAGDGDPDETDPEKLLVTFNSVKNIRVNTSAPGEKINMVDFLDFTDFVQAAAYVSDDHHYREYTCDGISIAGALTNGSPYGQFYLTVTNNSSRDISLTINNIKIKARKKAKDDFEVRPIISRLEYNDYLESVDAAAASAYRNQINPTASLVHRISNYGVKYDDYVSKIALSAIEGALRKNDAGKIEEYNQALQQERNKQWRNYLQNVSLKSGESYGGFVAFPNRKANSWLVTVTIDGKTYTFNYIK